MQQKLRLIDSGIKVFFCDALTENSFLFFFLFVSQILWDENIVPTECYSSEGTRRGNERDVS